MESMSYITDKTVSALRQHSKNTKQHSKTQKDNRKDSTVLENHSEIPVRAERLYLEMVKG